MRKVSILLLGLCVCALALDANTQDLHVLLSNGNLISPDGEGAPLPEVENVITVVPYNEGNLIITELGEIIADGVEAPFVGINFPFSIMVDFVLNPSGSGGYFLDKYGGVHPVGDAPFYGAQFFGSPFNPLPIAQSLVPGINAAGEVAGYYALNRFGEITTNGPIPELPSVMTNYAVSMRIAPDGSGFAVLTSMGHLISVGNIPVVEPLELENDVEAVDFSFTSSGDGYYILDSRGMIHSFGDAEAVDPIEVPEDTQISGLISSATVGSVDDFPEDLSPVPTSTPTNTPEIEPTATSTPTLIPPTVTATPTLIPPTATSTPIEGITPSPTSTPDAGTEPTNTPTPSETDTATPTPTESEAVTPTTTPTATVTTTPTVAATPTPSGPEIVEPGIDSRMLGTFDGTAINNTNGQSRDIRLRIAVENNQVVVEDLSTPALLSTNKLVMDVLDTQTIGYTAVGASLESLNLSLTGEGVGIIGGYTVSSGGFPPIPTSYAISIDL